MLIKVEGDCWVRAQRPLTQDELPKKAPMDAHIDELFKRSKDPKTGKYIISNSPYISFGDIPQERWDSIFGKKDY